MHHYYHFYKPVGCVSARKDAEHTTVMDYFPSELRETLFPLGRLDKNTEGLLLITDDGKLNHRLLDPENHIEKQYLLWAAGTLGEGELNQLRSGVHLKGLPEPTKPARVEVLRRTGGTAELSITIHEGKNRQVRRMCSACGVTVKRLQRIREHTLELGTLGVGKWRYLTEDEYRALARD